VLAFTKALGLTAADHERINVNGSGISLGHPVGATGVRILTTLLNEMTRREARYGLETMCIGGGKGLAAILKFGDVHSIDSNRHNARRAVPQASRSSRLGIPFRPASCENTSGGTASPGFCRIATSRDPGPAFPQRHLRA
jgi:hypothetical protein